MLRLSRTSARSLHCGAPLSAGHSKWANIRHDKAKNDARRAKEAYQMALRITLCVRQAGTEGNAQLATLMDKAKKLNVTKKIIEAAVRRGSGESAGDALQTHDVVYEFRGPGGVAVIVEATTDNKTRTVSLVKHAMSKFGAHNGACQYLFRRQGWVVFAPPPGASADDVLELAIDVGADDVAEWEDEEYGGEPAVYRVVADPLAMLAVANGLAAAGCRLLDVAQGWEADEAATVAFPEGHEKAFQKAVDLLDEVQEVTNYYTNIER
jgi:YebC/PmpR family DNA-binding regulatory protein